MKEMTKTVPAPAANPAAKDEVGGAVVTARTAPTATRPKRSSRETGIGSTAGIIEAPCGYYLRLKNKEDAMRKLGYLAAVVVAGAAALTVAHARTASAATALAVPPDAPATAKATIESKSGSKVTGRAVFTELPSGGVKAEVWIENAAPGTHGLHIHEKGDCSAADGTSAGGHFNAEGNPHAAPADAKHHNGDFGNIEIGADGKGHLEITSKALTVKPGPDSVVGKAVIFHEKADDLKTQPTGNAGGRFGCGVIQ
jgi:Cu-Zn family superoxide dismutase